MTVWKLMNFFSRPNRQRKRVAVLLLTLALSICWASSAAAEPGNWDDVLKRARGQTVDWFMWGGFPSTNAYVNGFVASRVNELYGIKLRQVPVTDIAEVISKLLVEKQAGKMSGGQADLLWINGENFRTAKRNGLLYGPFADRLPNQVLVDWSQPSVYNDFGEPVENLESPWGSAQVVMVFDSARTPTPPVSMETLLEWVRRHPGRFTYPAPPDFTGSVFVRQVFYHVSGGAAIWQEPMNEKRFTVASEKTYRALRELAPYLWRDGKTYPENPERLSQLFADKEVDFVLNEDLMIRAGRARVFLQDGRVVGGRNLYRPHCIMEIDSIDHTGFRVAAEPFRVSRVQRSTVQIARRDHFRVALRMVASSAYDGGVDRFHDGYHFWLTSDTQPEVMRLTCYGVYAAPIDLYPPTVEEINAALGQIGALRGDGNVVP